jgi:hypothetical protein
MPAHFFSRILFAPHDPEDNHNFPARDELISAFRKMRQHKVWPHVTLLIPPENA